MSVNSSTYMSLLSSLIELTAVYRCATLDACLQIYHRLPLDTLNQDLL